MAPEVISKSPYGTEVQHETNTQQMSIKSGKKMCAGIISNFIRHVYNDNEGDLKCAGGRLVFGHHGGGDGGWRTSVFQ